MLLARIGFSQGAGMAYEVAPRRPDQLAGVVAICGRMKRKGTLAAEVSSKPPFLILTGAEDRLLTADEAGQTAAILAKSDIPAMRIIVTGVGHTISDDGLAAARDFLKSVLHAAN